MFQPQSFNKIKLDKALSRVTVTRLSLDICWFTTIVTGQLCQYHNTHRWGTLLLLNVEILKTLPRTSKQFLCLHLKSCLCHIHKSGNYCDWSASNFGLNLWLPQITQSKTHVITTRLAVVVWLAACHNTHPTAFKQDSTSLHLQN